MGTDKKTLYFQGIREHISAQKLSLLSFALLLVLPTHPFKEGSNHWMERYDASGASEAQQLLKVYSVLRQQRGDLRDTWAWAIAETILTESKRHALDPLLVLAVINVESGFQHTAASTVGARGLMQIRPDVAKSLAEQRGSIFRKDKHPNGIPDLDDPIVNIKLGVFYLHSLKKSFQDLKLALTAYNWGPTEIRNRLAEEDPLPLEYAMKVLSTYQNYRKDSRQAD
jgi:soluble lytic murein transglycosylase-like protein